MAPTAKQKALTKRAAARGYRDAAPAPPLPSLELQAERSEDMHHLVPALLCILMPLGFGALHSSSPGDAWSLQAIVNLLVGALVGGFHGLISPCPVRRLRFDARGVRVSGGLLGPFLLPWQGIRFELLSLSRIVVWVGHGWLAIPLEMQHRDDGRTSEARSRAIRSLRSASSDSAEAAPSWLSIVLRVHGSTTLFLASLALLVVLAHNGPRTALLAATIVVGMVIGRLIARIVQAEHLRE